MLALAVLASCSKSSDKSPVGEPAVAESEDKPDISSEERCRQAIEHAFDLKLDAAGASAEAKAQIAPDRDRSVLELVPKCLAALESHDEGEQTSKALDCILAAKSAEQAQVCGLL